MSEDLMSQNQIDAMFAELTGEAGTPDEVGHERFRSVRPYDFRHPSKLSKEQLRTLQMIFEGYARLVGTNLSGILRSQVHMALVSVEQAVFADYARTLLSTTLINLVTAEPLPGTLAFEYDLGAAFVMLDRFLGGSGTTPPQEREVTEIEEVLLQSIAAVFVDALSAVWAHLIPMQAKLQRLEYSPRFLQIAPPTEPVVLLLFDLRVQDRQTTMSLCLPYSVIEPITPQLNVQSLFTAAQRHPSEEEVEGARARLQRVSIPVVATLGTTALPLADVNGLQEGDVIRLDGLASDPLVLTVNKKPTYVVRPGLVRGGLAVQILGVLQDQDGETSL